MTRATAISSLLIPGLFLAACAGNAGSYPSLAMREAERVSGTAEPASSEPTPAPPPITGELSERIAALVASARRAHQDFLARQADTRHAVSTSAGAAVASEGWTQALVALAGLEALRSGALVSLAELDQLYAAERIAYPDAPTPSALAIEEARGQVHGWVEQENETLASLSRRFGG